MSLEGTSAPKPHVLGVRRASKLRGGSQGRRFALPILDFDFSPHSHRSQRTTAPTRAWVCRSTHDVRLEPKQKTFQAIRTIGIITYGCSAKKPEIVPFCYEGFRCLFLSNDSPKPRSEVAVCMQLRWIALVYAAGEHPAGQGRARKASFGYLGTTPV